MVTWNCTNCDMLMTLVETIPNVICPICGMKMIKVSDRILCHLKLDTNSGKM